MYIRTEETVEALRVRKRERKAEKSGKEIGTHAGRGIDIGGPGGDGDGMKGGRGGPEEHRGVIGGSGGAGRDTNTLKIRFITFLLRFRGGTTKGCPG